MNHLTPHFFFALLVACSEEPKSTAVQNIDVEIDSDLIDKDDDGYLGSEDCDDSDANINPGEAEICDEIDNNCNGEIDEGVLQQLFLDTDGDGFGDPQNTLEACEVPDGFVFNGSDCDDDNADFYPGAPEECDGLDNNCNGEIDEDLGNLWYVDADGDGYGDESQVVQTCSPEANLIERGGDCDDDDASVYLGAPEECDEVDNNCNGEIDETGSLLWYSDTDGDGFGDINVNMQSCTQPSGYVGNALDCDDIDPMINPNATEVCDWVDNDCNGTLDDNASDALSWYIDADSDGFGSASTITQSCVQPLGYSNNSDDCDDGRFETNPNALEFCNGIDDDCNGQPDDGNVVDFIVYYSDSDGDGYGDPFSPVQGCSAPANTVSNGQDCNDADPAVYPYATETCNQQDDNCNGITDEMAIDQQVFYEDADGDGYGGTTFQLSCTVPSGYVTQIGDCNDNDPSISPSATEVCNALDDDCNGAVDENITTTIWYYDGDSDGYGTSSLPTYNCLQPSGYVSNELDCDDNSASINPLASESCNGIDDDCDGAADGGMLGGDEICTAASCLDILTAHPTAPDGQYFIAFPSGTQLAECDMGSFGGGWTQVFYDPMEPPDPGWSFQDTFSCGIWGTILGGYDLLSGPNYTVGMTENTISTQGIPHSEVWMELDYITLDSWDIDTWNPATTGEDHAYVNFNGNSIWYEDVNNHASIYGQVCGWYRPTYQIGSLDSRHYISHIEYGYFPSVVIVAGSTLDQPPADESFGLDDVYVWVR